MNENVNRLATEHLLTAIVLTFNEEANIGACLRSLDWVDEVIVVDSGSTDLTIVKARESRSDVRVFTNAFEDFGQQRNWAIDQTQPSNPWILFLDADEQSTPDFARAVLSAIVQKNGIVGYYLCAKNFFLGQWIRRSTFYPSWQLRLLRKGEVRFEKMGHGQKEVTSGKLSYINEPYDHYPFSKGIADWIARHNKYSTEEAPLIRAIRKEHLRLIDLFSMDSVVRRRCLKRIASRTQLLRPLLMFIYTYCFRLGCLDGRAGLVFAFLRTSHEMHNVAKVSELSSKCPNDAHK